ncbi:hypothetical protein BXZ70DRAFT_602876 [Cristinia sonorae]|uniref:F-box domain-containing protein n=1 Tax=Cristinia sonorae TaxID=1940300 RepID=A0A8K0UUQ2_9AGAR|nr:hypothetical protein BXZ70DRAFT_602876 [Cristinia sonorae]
MVRRQQRKASSLSRPSLQKLPDETLDHIASYLADSATMTLPGPSLTCRSLSNVARPFVFRCIVVDADRIAKLDCTLNETPAMGFWIKELTMVPSIEIFISGSFRSLLGRLKKVDTLVFKGWHKTSHHPGRATLAGNLLVTQLYPTVRTLVFNRVPDLEPIASRYLVFQFFSNMQSCKMVRTSVREHHGTAHAASKTLYPIADTSTSESTHLSSFTVCTGIHRLRIFTESFLSKHSNVSNIWS